MVSAMLLWGISSSSSMMSNIRLRTPALRYKAVSTDNPPSMLKPPLHLYKVQFVTDCRPAADLHGRQVAGFAHLLYVDCMNIACYLACLHIGLVQTPANKGLVPEQN
jgi:hypothetical protein